MKEYIHVDKLFGDDYRALVICEFSYEIDLIKKIIETCYEGVNKKKTNDIDTYEGISYRFAESIVSYAKMSYDNLLLGHFDLVSMIDRILIENIVCMDLILNNVEKGKELWKYYLVHSYKKDIFNSKKVLTEKETDDFMELCNNLGIDKTFLEKRISKSGKEYSYIDLNYGWTYKINKNFSFKGLCELIDENDYKIFSMASLYAHGTSIYLKVGSNMGVDRIFYLITSIYIALYRMVTMYCWDCVDDEFDELSEEIESIIYNYINHYDF